VVEVPSRDLALVRWISRNTGLAQKDRWRQRNNRMSDPYEGDESTTDSLCRTRVP
jgi:hypothetical protein